MAIISVKSYKKPDPVESTPEKSILTFDKEEQVNDQKPIKQDAEGIVRSVPFFDELINDYGEALTEEVGDFDTYQEIILELEEIYRDGYYFLYHIMDLDMEKKSPQINIGMIKAEPFFFNVQNNGVGSIVIVRINPLLRIYNRIKGKLKNATKN